MNQHYNEEMAWRRLQDIQTEMENHRLIAGGGPDLIWWPVRLAQRVWTLAGLASMRPPRFSAKRSRAYAREPWRPNAT